MWHLAIPPTFHVTVYYLVAPKIRKRGVQALSGVSCGHLLSNGVHCLSLVHDLTIHWVGSNPCVFGMGSVSYLQSSSLSAHAGLTRRGQGERRRWVWGWDGVVEVFSPFSLLDARVKENKFSGLCVGRFYICNTYYCLWTFSRLAVFWFLQK